MSFKESYAFLSIGMSSLGVFLVHEIEEIKDVVDKLGEGGVTSDVCAIDEG